MLDACPSSLWLKHAEAFDFRWQKSPGSLSQELWAKPLKMTLGTWLTVMAPKNLMRLKAHLVDGWMVGRLDVAASFQGQPGNGMKWL